MTPVPESGIAAKATPPATSPSTIVTSTTERPRPRSGAYMKQPPLIEFDLVESLDIELRSIQSMAVGDRPPTREGEGRVARRARAVARSRPPSHGGSAHRARAALRRGHHAGVVRRRATVDPRIPLPSPELLRRY